MRQLRFGLIGAGAMAQAYAHVLRNHPRARIAAVADTRPEAAMAMAETLGCPVYASATDLADQAGVDAAIVCTPPSTHAAISLLCMAHGLHVLCEKPLCTDLATAQTMYAAARRQRTLLAMASKFRYTTDVVAARSLLVSGSLGEVSSLRNIFCAPVNMGHRWNSEPAISGGGVVIDNGTHSADLIRYLAGPVRQVFASEGRRFQQLGVEETVHLIARTESGVQASVDLSWSVPDPGGDYIQISCSGGAIAIGWQGSAYRRHPGAEWTRFGEGYNKFDALRRQMDNFAGAVMGEEALRISDRDALASVEVVSAAYASLATEQWQTVAAGLDARATVA
jgi:predicted dehydrogenase